VIFTWQAPAGRDEEEYMKIFYTAVEERGKTVLLYTYLPRTVLGNAKS